MNWTKTPPTQEGWYYLREDERDDWCIVEVWPKVDGGFFIGDGKDVADINALGYEWGGRVPAPGTTWNVEEIEAWMKSEGCVVTATLITDKHRGIAATTARHRKEQG